MDTTSEFADPLDRVTALLAAVEAADPAESVGPMAEIADILEDLLDGDDS